VNRCFPTSVAYPRHLHGNRTDPGHHLALGQIAVMNQAGPAIFDVFAGMHLEKRHQFRLDGPLDQARHGPQQSGRRSRQKPVDTGRVKMIEFNSSIFIVDKKSQLRFNRHDMPLRNGRYQLSGIARTEDIIVTVPGHEE